jgi:phosphatidylserine/phosphatidylglycerophosphate/cardiolipin synthase-like enzyme
MTRLSLNPLHSAKRALLITLLGLSPVLASVRAGIEVFFSPKGGCTEAVVQELNLAKSTIYVQAYSFTSKPIAAALVNALRRGVKVQAIMDKSQRKEKYSEADFLAHNHITTFIDSQHAIAHNKIIVVDERVVLTGSFNFTRAAEESNAENLLLITDPAIARRYLQNWQEHRRHAENYAGRGPATPFEFRPEAETVLELASRESANPLSSQARLFYLARFTSPEFSFYGLVSSL